MSRCKREPTFPLQSSDSKRFTPSDFASELPESDSEAELDFMMASSEFPVSGSNEPLAEPPIVTLDQKTIQLISDSVQNSIAPTIQEIVKTAVQEAIQALEKKVQSLQVENQELKTENESLRSRVSSLEQTTDDQEQYSRRNCLRIAGITERPDENTDAIVLEVASDLGVGLTPQDIDRSHRVGKPGGSRPRGIIVKLATYRARERLFRHRKALKDQPKGKDVYINEDLTLKRSQVLYRARQLVREKKLNGAWSFDGVLFIRTVDGNRHRITTDSDIEAVAPVTAGS